jgi:Mg-chelatase subunit ChlD
MHEKRTVHNLIILDESGSMESIKRVIIDGFNEIVQTAQGIAKEFPEQMHYVSLVSFNGLGQKLLHFIDPIDRIEEINHRRYSPNASTPLYDAIGFSIKKLQQVLNKETNYNVLVTILTDGEENASKEYSGKQIKLLIEELQQEGWTFTYMGTDHDVEKAAFSLSIHNTITFDKNPEGIHKVFEAEKLARKKYSEKLRNQEDTLDDFYKS